MTGGEGTGPPPTKRGVPFDEAASAFQKAIRRGQEEDALRWAAELHRSGFTKYVWRRVFVMLSEDVGLAEPQLPATIWALYEIAHPLGGGRGPGASGGMELAHAGLVPARARKSRVVDHALIWAWTDKEP